MRNWLALGLLAFPLTAQSVSVEKGNIVFRDGSGRSVQLTSSGRDSEPNLSWDATLAVFLREIPGTEDVDGDRKSEIWIADLQNGALRAVVAETPPMGFQRFSMPQFSRGNGRLYFSSAYGVTGRAVWIYDLSARRFTYVCYGFGPEVIRKGRYAGYFVAAKSFLPLIPGRVVRWYLFDPDGKEIAEIGEREGALEEFYEMYDAK